MEKNGLYFILVLDLVTFQDFGQTLAEMAFETYNGMFSAW